MTDSDDGERAAWLQYERTGEVACRNTIIEAYFPMVRRVARRVRRGLPDTVDLDDLISMGTLGLIDAIERFDVHRGIPFATYCLRRVRGAILDGLRSQDRIPRGIRELGALLDRVCDELRARLSRMPTIFETAAELHVTPAECLRLERRRRAFAMERGQRSLERAKSSNASPVQAVHWSQVRDLAMRGLDARERRILTLYYFEGLHLKDIAALLRVTQSRVAQIHGELIAKLRRTLHRSRRDLFYCA